MSPRNLLLLLLGLLSFVGCLQEGPAPTGRRLFAGQSVEGPGFILLNGDVWARFEQRKAFPTTSKGGVLDLWRSSLDGSEQRKLVANLSDRWGEQPIHWLPDDQLRQLYSSDWVYYADERYFMVDESQVVHGATSTPVASLIRLGSTLNEELRIPGISSYMRFTVPLRTIYGQPSTCPGFPGVPTAQNNCPQLLYERPALDGETYPSLYLYDGANELRIGADAGSFQVQPAGSGAIYFILGDHKTLTRLNRPSNTLDLLRDNVSRFMIRGDERYVAIATIATQAEKSKTVVRDLTSGTELPLAKPNPSSWGSFQGNTFTYWQNGTSTTQAEQHTLDLDTGNDSVELLPKPLLNFGGAFFPTRDSDERLLLDSQGHGVFVGKNDYVARRTVDASPLLFPAFSADGKFFAYIAPALPTLFDTSPRGALMLQDTALAEPPRMISTPGLQVPAYGRPGFFFTAGNSGEILVFWAYLGRGNSDLFFADYHTGDLTLIARSILSVSISAHSLFGILNASQQDGVGDLIYRDIDRGSDILYAHAVDDFSLRSGADFASSSVAYVVRGRTDSDRSGLWLAPLAPPASPDGGTD